MLMDQNIVLEEHFPSRSRWLEVLEDKVIPGLPNIPESTDCNLHEARASEQQFSIVKASGKRLVAIPRNPDRVLAGSSKSTLKE